MPVPAIITKQHRLLMPGHAGHGFWLADDSLRQAPLVMALAEAAGLVAEPARLFTGPVFVGDITDVVDMLSEPQGPLAEAQRLAAQACGAAKACFLSGGSSVGIKALMLALAGEGERLVLGRNAHRSVLDGLVLNGATPCWILPEWLSDWGVWGRLSPASLEVMLAQHPSAKAVVVTSPTYEGICSDIAALSAIAQAHGALLVVDEAHGALSSFAPSGSGMPASALSQGADLVVQSWHKTAGSLTGAAVLLASQRALEKLGAARLQQALNTLHTTSPFWPALASLDGVRAYWQANCGQAHLKNFLNAVQQLRRRLNNVGVPVMPTNDPTKLWLHVASQSGRALAERLEKNHGLMYERAEDAGFLYMLQPGLLPAAFEALETGLRSISVKGSLEPLPHPLADGLPRQVCTPRQAWQASLKQSQASLNFATEPVVPYPPGIPTVVPGEALS